MMMDLLGKFGIELIGIVLGSVGVGSIITALANKGNLKAQTNNLIGKTYGDLIDELRKTTEYQGSQIKLMQDREVEFLKIINTHISTEMELRTKIKALETKLSLYIKSNK